MRVVARSLPVVVECPRTSTASALLTTLPKSALPRCVTQACTANGPSPASAPERAGSQRWCSDFASGRRGPDFWPGSTVRKGYTATRGLKVG
jgi:hypothetical protein